MSHEKSIAVIGCGVTGLATACFLKQQDYDVTLFELFAEPQAIGAGLLLQPTGLAVLQHLDLAEQVMQYGHKIINLHGQSVCGRTVFDLNYTDLAPQLFGVGLHRGTLFTLLYEKAKQLAIPIVTQCKIVDSKIKKQQRVLIDQMATEYGAFDLVIDASGMRSMLCAKYGQVKLNKLYPYGALWGVCQDPDQHFQNHCLQQLYDKAHIMIGTLGLGKLLHNEQNYVNFFWSIPIADYPSWKSQDFHQWKQKVNRYWPAITPLTEQFNSVNDLTFSQYHDIVMKKWYGERIVFIGDAAHSTSPQLGQGANLGLMDAWVLSNALIKHSSIDHALLAYQKHRYHHIHFYQLASRWITPFFQSDSKAAAWLRDRLFKRISKIPYIRQEMLQTLVGIKTGLWHQLDLDKL